MIYVTGDRPLPHQIRAATFDTRWRGLDPTQVHAYLARIADELDRVRRDLTTATTEAERIRQALRQWQSRHAACHHPDQSSPNSRWPR
ncbi:DivIVA domain-containing protein [Micromonospora mirobrigensis]|uniref:Cell wall synthesis protein Wag31 n=1 Tax=Micromonospora mirobrigensis TaxID=262898 RepID=A0A1C4UDN2_9ACTN|nr:DivIVA domain-containing protein [Micromonospora mirobrigensis]SCE69752.1 DivIVA domain-containing protein [Micromonospora mirobrigensis]